MRVLFRVFFYNVCFRLSTGIEEGAWLGAAGAFNRSEQTPGSSDEGSDQETDRFSPGAGTGSSMERHVGWRDELPLAVIPRVVSLFAAPSQSALNKNAEQARVASASLYPEQEGYADSNRVMLYYLSAEANARTPTW